MEGYENNAGGDKKRLCTRSPVDQVNSLMWDWFQKARSNGFPVSGPMLREKALQFTRELNVPEADFKASTGWLNRFRQRHNISFMSVCGESASVSQETVDSWCERIPELVRGNKPRDIYNMDETGLFFRALSDKSLSVSGDECKG
ncbi:tigger transposable element-derived protein 6-like [Mercenaria mercenaria]|uniref:tigger transposable element-derived protein 6-like n=1 Tax=Mercenaria mercenaria TaxID=6596 RepID=UPI00234ED496|nr:tigger transposable element-derived protein 6-like [Mercenaria mercenaria]